MAIKAFLFSGPSMLRGEARFAFRLKCPQRALSIPVLSISSVGPAPPFLWCRLGARRAASAAGRCSRRDRRPRQHPVPLRPPILGGTRAKLRRPRVPVSAAPGSAPPVAVLPFTYWMPSRLRDASTWLMWRCIGCGRGLRWFALEGLIECTKLTLHRGILCFPACFPPCN